MTASISSDLKFWSNPVCTAKVADDTVRPNTKALGVLSGTIAILGTGIWDFLDIPCTIFSKNTFSPFFR